MNSNSDIKFNIYNPVITYEHRAAYDSIVSQLQEIFPICNQGKCKALEVTDDPQKQKQINDLMEKVESFFRWIDRYNKTFFDHLYRAKESSFQSIFHSTAKIKIDMIERNLLERTCDVRWWALEKSFSDCIELSNSQNLKVRNSKTVASKQNLKSVKLSKLISYACTRLEDIRSSYTLYRDLVIVGADGIVIANSNPLSRKKTLGINVSDEEWFKQALKTNNGTEYFAQDFCKSKLESVDSLIYSTAIRSNGDENGSPIGVLGVLFDFQGECQNVLNDYLPQDEHGITLDGWHSFFTNHKGKVICSNNEDLIPIQSTPDLPKNHRFLNAPGDFIFSNVIFCGVRSLIVSHRSEGFDNYPGLGWTSHLVIPVATIFDRSSELSNLDITSKELLGSSLIPETNRQTFQEIQRNKGDIQLISINGIILATDLGKSGKSFMPIFDQITEAGSSTTGKMEFLLSEMSSDMLGQNLKALENLSKQSIELIDRNLFERAADVRWWATDHVFWNSLSKMDSNNYDEASKRLAVINASYTMYRDLILVDSSGNIVANSKMENRKRIKELNISSQTWFKQALQISNSVQYVVQDVGNTNLEDENTSLIYAGAIIDLGQRSGKVIGVLGILFDWNAIATSILECCSPRIHGSLAKGSAAFYLNREHTVIASTDVINFPVGAKLNLPESSVLLKDGASSSGIFNSNGKKYIIGSSRSKGYREYNGLDWTSHVVRSFN